MINEEKRRMLLTAVWERKIDQMSTREVAEEYGMSQRDALQILKKIAAGTSGDSRFVYDPERQGVLIKDGSVFTYSPMDLDGQGMTVGRNVLKHFIWFCS